MLGATTSITSSLSACSTWPACDGRWIVPLSDPAAIPLAHRIVALIVGIGLSLTIIRAWKRESRRVQLLLWLSMILYLGQIGIGALTVALAAGPVISTLHLTLAMTIFGALVLALAWSLESRYTDAMGGTTTQASSSTPVSPADQSSFKATLNGYFRLMKPRLMWLLCLVAAAGMALAAGPALEIGTIVATLSAGVLAIGASGTFNHVLERDIDKRMTRTASRPVVTDQIPVRNAILFGFVLTSVSIAIFAVFTNWLATALGISAIIFYSIVYTLLLKPNTVQNTVIGGAAGALPALIGWAAVTGSIGIPALLLAGVIFAWTPAHFYNLAMAYKDDYARGEFPMLPVVRGDRVTRKHILLYAGLTLLLAALLSAVSQLGWLYALAAIVGGAGFLAAIYFLHANTSRSSAMRTFHASNAYLGLILVVVTVDALVM